MPKAHFLSDNYRFVDYIAEPVTIREGFFGWAEHPQHSIGAVALTGLQGRLERDAKRYLSASPGEQVYGGIDTFDVVELMWSVANEADTATSERPEKITNSPVSFTRTSSGYRPDYTPLALTDVLGNKMTKTAFRELIASSAGNFSRFNRVPINKLMMAFTKPGDVRSASIHEGITENDIPGIVKMLLADSVRATQRIDGTSTRLTDMDGYQRVYATANQKGQPILSWAYREVVPPMELYHGNKPPISGPVFQPVVSRQKCPIASTLSTDISSDGKKIVMPGQRIAAAMQGYMHDNLLLYPAIYMSKAPWSAI